MFWPREIWGRYAEQLADFQHQRHSKAAVQCLNHMITDALRSADMIYVCTDAADMASTNSPEPPPLCLLQVPGITCLSTQPSTCLQHQPLTPVSSLMPKRADCGLPGRAGIAPLLCVESNECVMPTCAGTPPTACSTWGRCEITRTSGSVPSPR